MWLKRNQCDGALASPSETQRMSVTWYKSRAPSRSPDWVQRRRSERRPVNLKVAILEENGAMMCHCKMADVSEGGAKLMVDEPSAIPECFVLVLSYGARTRRKCKVRWRSGSSIGVEFLRD